MFLTFRKNSLLAGLGAAVFLLAVILLTLGNGREKGRAVSASLPLPTAVIDAGHGGEDGGAVSSDGTVRESTLNLAIAQDLNDLLRLLGFDTVMIRTEDVSVYSPGEQTLRAKKVSDLKNRVALVNSVPNAVLFSIHQNSLPSHKSVHGAQVFYNGADGGQEIALSVQDALNEAVNGESAKECRRIDDSIYLMKNAGCPAILAECGFLSNEAETKRLQEPEYQQLLSAAIAAGFCRSLAR